MIIQARKRAGFDVQYSHKNSFHVPADLLLVDSWQINRTSLSFFLCYDASERPGSSLIQPLYCRVTGYGTGDSFASFHILAAFSAHAYYIVLFIYWKTSPTIGGLNHSKDHRWKIMLMLSPEYDTSDLSVVLCIFRSKRTQEYIPSFQIKVSDSLIILLINIKSNLPFQPSLSILLKTVLENGDPENMAGKNFLSSSHLSSSVTDIWDFLEPLHNISFT